MQPYHHTIHKKHIKPSSCIAKFPYQLRMYKKYFLFSDHFSRNAVLFLLVYIMFFRTHLKISFFTINTVFFHTCFTSSISRKPFKYKEKSIIYYVNHFILTELIKRKPCHYDTTFHEYNI